MLLSLCGSLTALLCVVVLNNHRVESVTPVRWLLRTTTEWSFSPVRGPNVRVRLPRWPTRGASRIIRCTALTAKALGGVDEKGSRRRIVSSLVSG
jgi:hypothetical protein